jgi:urease accessory protein
MRLKALPAICATAAAAVPAVAFAHTGHGSPEGLMFGFAHPFAGLDHLAAMVAVGLWAARSPGRAVAFLPAAFLAAMVVGALLAFQGVGLPAVETVLAASVVFLGVLIAFKVRIHAAGATALVAAFAIFHGHAHGAEISAESPAIGYAAGFIAATAILHMIGIVAGRSVSGRAARVGGGIVAALGVVVAGI